VGKPRSRPRFRFILKFIFILRKSSADMMGWKGAKNEGSGAVGPGMAEPLTGRAPPGKPSGKADEGGGEYGSGLGIPQSEANPTPYQINFIPKE